MEYNLISILIKVVVDSGDRTLNFNQETLQESKTMNVTPNKAVRNPIDII